MEDDPMAKLDEARRDRLKDATFAYIDDDGDRKLPLNDETHVRNAIARFAQTSFDSADDKRKAAKKILAAAKKHDIEVADDDAVARAAR
jgi:hypothetical protein